VVRNPALRLASDTPTHWGRARIVLPKTAPLVGTLLNLGINAAAAKAKPGPRRKAANFTDYFNIQNSQAAWFKLTNLIMMFNETKY
jgi:hypothetical protein